MTLKTRLLQLEERYAKQNPLPFVVRQIAGETKAEAVERTLNGRKPPPDWCFVFAPPVLTVKEWAEKYSPQSDVVEVENPETDW